MKKLMVICAAGVCSFVIGITAIAGELSVNPKETIRNEKEAVKEAAAGKEKKAAKAVKAEANTETPVNTAAPVNTEAEVTTKAPENTEAAITTEVPVNTEAAKEKVEVKYETAGNNEEETVEVNVSAAQNVSSSDELVSSSSTTAEILYIPQEENVVVQPQETAPENTVQFDVNTQQPGCGREDCIFTDANQDGYCDYCNRYCMNDCDADGDGICDRFHTGHNNSCYYNGGCAGNAYCGQGSGSHHSGGHHGGRHH